MTAVEDRFETSLHVTPHRCESWYCSRCAVRRGIPLQEKIAKVVAGWRCSLMLTLTVDPKRFDGPYEAWDHARRCIGRLIRDLRRAGLFNGMYFATWEQHKSGWPHWHVLLEASFIKHDVVQRLWHSYAPGGRMGGVDLRRHPRFLDPMQRARYATKYLTKYPKDGWADWVLRSGRRIQRYSVSHGFFKGGAGFCQRPKRDIFREYEIEDEPPVEKARRTFQERPLQEKLDTCGRWCTITRIVEWFAWWGSAIYSRQNLGFIYASKAELRALCGLDPEEKLPWVIGEFDGLNWLPQLAGVP